ncbi:MAG: hypothetical protein NWE94_02150 [Candidatus Bathyarchaeota archaeon]|nr:hypothetical protein [Candidatus Bathyarchaeota archaeon]
MAGATLDHLVSVTILLAAVLLFISLFNQTIQTATIYQQHSASAAKCSDLLDTMLLNEGFPLEGEPAVFGLRDTSFAQYVINSSSLMRLNSSTGKPVLYEGLAYSNMAVGLGNSLLVPMDSVVNYSSALKMLGLYGAYGFQLTLTPVVTVSITENSSNPLSLTVNARGVGFPLAKATVNYCLMSVSLSGAHPEYLASQTGTVSTDAAGSVSVSFSGFAPNETLTYVFMAYAHVGGVTGVGFYTPAPSSSAQLVSLVKSLSARQVMLAHSYDFSGGTDNEPLTYNLSFVFWDEDSTLKTLPLENPAGTVISGSAPPFVTLPLDKAGVLVVAYCYGNGTSGGVAVMPWGVGSLAFPVVFGGDPIAQEWVTTDMRQVLINGVAYQVKLSLWSLGGVQVVG